jgi:molecular chaperone GrpE
MSDARELDPIETRAPDDAGRDGRSAADEEIDVEIVSFGDEDDAPAESVETSNIGAERELVELREHHLRLRADFENFRKRAEREREERLRRGIAETVRELLPVADNLTRALAAEGGLDDLRRGVEMIARQLAEVLRRQGVVAIEALGQPFDPQLHEAVAREESAAVEVPTVVAELQRGYVHGDRLLRPAMVRVALPVAIAGSAALDAPGDDRAADEGEP